MKYWSDRAEKYSLELRVIGGSGETRANPVRGPVIAAVIACLVLAAGPVQAQSWGQGPPPRVAPTPAGETPRDLEDVRIDQRLDQQLPLDSVFRDEQGNQVKLGDFFGSKPVVLALVYYSCPMLCDQVLNGMTSSLDVLKNFDIGKDFEVVTVSFDPNEGPDLARQKKETYIRWYKREGAAEGWHFLTGDQANISRLTEAAGFHYKWDEKTNQFIHASGIMIATSEGKLARYFYGIEYAPRDLRLGLVEASAGKIGTPVDQLLLYCYHYDPASGKYGAVVINMIRLGGVATLLGIIAMFIAFRRRLTGGRRASARGTT
jgi:protein SCO1/2